MTTTKTTIALATARLDQANIYRNTWCREKDRTHEERYVTIERYEIGKYTLTDDSYDKRLFLTRDLDDTIENIIESILDGHFDAHLSSNRDMDDATLQDTLGDCINYTFGESQDHEWNAIAKDMTNEERTEIHEYLGPNVVS